MSLQILSVFVLYLFIILAIGFFSYRKSNTISDYILGGRGLGSWLTALSAQASDMSGWLLMGLPGALYLSGLCEAWLAIGLAVGTYLNWRFVAYRLRVFSSSMGNALTMPEYLSNRFGDTSNALKTVTAVFITIFFLLYTASGIVAGAKLFSTVFGLSYTTALLIGWFLILFYTFLGGFLAVCWTDLIQGSLMFVALLIVPVTILVVVGGFAEASSWLTDAGAGYLSPFTDVNGTSFAWQKIVSNLAWGLGYFGMPHVLVRFMAIQSPSMLKKSRRIATVWVVVSLTASIFIGILGHAYLSHQGIVLSAAESESIFLILMSKLFPPLIAGFLLAAVLSAIMSTADSQLLVSASAIANDLVKGYKKNIAEHKLLWISRFSVLAIALLALLIALNPNNSVMALVSHGWAGLGGAFGPIMLLSLFWRKTTLKGAVAGIVTGGVTVILWTLFAEATQIYALLPAFLLSLAVIVVVSLADKNRTAEAIFDQAKTEL